MRVEPHPGHGAPGRTEAPSASSFRALLGERTPLGASDAKSALGEAYRDVVGKPPSPSTLAVLTAQWAHETDGGRAMFGNNFGGIRATKGGVALVTREGAGHDAVHTVGRFRTYETVQRGASDYVRLLARRYPEALAAASEGRLEPFVNALGRGGYFTDAPAAYLRGLRFRIANVALPASPLSATILTRISEWFARAIRAD